MVMGEDSRIGLKQRNTAHLRLLAHLMATSRLTGSISMTLHEILNQRR